MIDTGIEAEVDEKLLVVAKNPFTSLIKKLAPDFEVKINVVLGKIMNDAQIEKLKDSKYNSFILWHC